MLLQCFDMWTVVYIGAAMGLGYPLLSDQKLVLLVLYASMAASVPMLQASGILGELSASTSASGSSAQLVTGHCDSL
jgi:hypothetical protein